MSAIYLLIDVASISVPFIFSFHPKLQFYKQWRSFFLACLITLIPFLLWDMFFTEIGVWGFNPNYLSGFNIGNLPVEEVLFFICIPYACVFTYHCIDRLYKVKLSIKVTTISTYALIALLVTGVIFNLEKMYSVSIFVSLSVFLSLLLLLRKADWIGKFYIVFSILLIPFLIVNGVLTGSFLDDPIVWYNNNENMNFRIFTIPLEDVFYAMLLIGPNIYLFDTFRKKA
jgi:lycopene cyclase domain-containing protein